MKVDDIKNELDAVLSVVHGVVIDVLVDIALDVVQGVVKCVVEVSIVHFLHSVLWEFIILLAGTYLH